MKYTALLPLKAHSERIPNKNFREFGGKPLYRWILESLLSLDCIEHVIINTDANDSLLKLDQKDSDRIKVHQRPAELCGDFVSMNKIISYDIQHHNAECFLMTHSTNPLITASTLDALVNEYELALSNGYDSVFSVTQLKTRLYDHQAKPINHNPEELKRTQDLPPVYEENSCAYIFSRTSFHSTNRRIGLNPKMVTTPPMESIDIDDHHHWRLAELILKGRQ